MFYRVLNTPLTVTTNGFFSPLIFPTDEVILERRRENYVYSNQPYPSQYLRSKLTIKTLEQRSHWRRSGVFVNFEHISLLVLVFLLLTLSK